MFMNSSQDICGTVEYTSRNDGNVQTNTIIWTIPNFINILNNKSIPEIRAPKPTSTPPVESKFRLMLQFLGVERSMVEIYYLSHTPELLKSVTVKRTNEQYNYYGGQTFVNISTKECQFVEADKWQYLTHLFKLEASDSSAKKITLANGSLRLSFEFMVTIKNIGIASFASLVSAPQPPAIQLVKDLENLFNNSMYSDVVMKSADDEEFKVHKVILASRSSVLKAHFDHNFTENVTNVVETHLESAVLHEVLSFIYTDKAPRLDKFPEKLLAAADFYQLSQLKRLCEDALQKKLTVDNAIETLQLADLHSTKKLKQQTLEFMKYGRFKSIIKTEGWRKLNSIALIKEICEYCN